MLSKPDTDGTSFGKALYYPYVHIQDVNVLKAALLYWDGIRRIVPSSYSTSPLDSREVRDLADSGLLLNTDPDPYTAKSGDLFTDLMEPLFEEPARDSSRIFAEIARALPGTHLGYVHEGKVTAALRERLRSRGLLEQDQEWLSLAGKLGGVYMICLASEMSDATRASLVSDDPAVEAWGQYLRFGVRPSVLPASRANQDSILARLEIKLPAPEALAHVPISRITQFSRKRADERLRFRRAVEAVSQDIARLDDPNAIDDCLAENRLEIEAARQDHLRALDELAVGRVVSALAISAPTGILATKLAELNSMPSESAAVLGLGMTAISVVGWVAKRRGQRRKAIQSCPWHYMLSVKRAFH